MREASTVSCDGREVREKRVLQVSPVPCVLLLSPNDYW